MNCTRCGKWAGAYARGAGQPVDDLCHCPPVKREWQGLTDEERQSVIDETHPDNRWTLAERIELKLKSKNGF